MGKITVVGIGPGKPEGMTYAAVNAIKKADAVVGYKVYINLVKDFCDGKEIISSGMRQEEERCRLCINLSQEGKNVALVCSGDAGIYAMASLMYEVAEEYEDVEIDIIAGVTAASSGAAVLGAPVGHDFCLISLSDLKTPWDVIAKRLECAAKGDFAISIYNPASMHRPDYLKKACDILLKDISPDTVCGYVENIGRDDEKYQICTLSELRETSVNMFTTVFIGNSNTKVINGKMVTPRGYLQ